VAAPRISALVVRHEPRGPINGLGLVSYLWDDSPSCRTLKGEMMSDAVTGAAWRAKAEQGDFRIERKSPGALESQA
jgi:hypothetical protein